MKPCIKCRAELPDSAGHCIYCGVGQPAPAQNKATMMGHPGLGKELAQQAGVPSPAPNPGIAPAPATPADANQVIAQARQQQQDQRQRSKSQPVHYGGAPQQQQQGQQQQQQGQFGEPPPGQQQGQFGGPPPGQAPYGQTPPPQQQQYGAPPQQQQYGAPPQQQQGGAPGQAPYGQTPPAGQQPYSQTPPAGQQPYGGPPQQQQQYGGPQQQQQQYGGPQQQQYGGPQQQLGAPQARQQSPFGGAKLGVQDAQFGAQANQQQPYGIPSPGGYRDALTEQVKPLRAPTTTGEAEQWDESLTTQMLVFGVLLIACFVAPWAVGGDKTLFSWSVFSGDGVPWSQKLLPILLAATGVIAVGLGALKLSVTSRAFSATAIGLAPILYFIVGRDTFVWQSAVGAVGTVMLISGLILRSRYPEAKMARVVATVGVLALLALYLIPVNGGMPIKGIIDALSAMPGKAKLIPIIGSGIGGATGLLPFVLTLMGLLVWMKGPGKAGTHSLAWAMLFWGLLGSLVLLLVSGGVIDALKAGLSVYLYVPLANVAWMSLACFGIAGVLGSQLNE